MEKIKPKTYESEVVMQFIANFRTNYNYLLTVTEY